MIIPTHRSRLHVYTGTYDVYEMENVSSNNEMKHVEEVDNKKIFETFSKISF